MTLKWASALRAAACASPSDSGPIREALIPPDGFGHVNVPFCATTVAPLLAGELDPPLLDAVTAHVIVWPSSSTVTTYVFDVAPETGLELTCQL